MIKMALFGVLPIVSFYTLFYIGDYYETLESETNEKMYKSSTCYIMAVILGLGLPIISGIII